MNTTDTNEQQAPERIYIHPCSVEYHLNKWPLEEGEYIEYTRSRAVGAAPGDEWLPIETAPKDGTKMLFYTPEDSEIGWQAFIAESFYDKRGDLNDVHVSQWQDGLEPTHWMPLPKAPNAATTSSPAGSSSLPAEPPAVASEGEQK